MVDKRIELSRLLKCCNKAVQILEQIDLYNTKNQTHRILVIGRCKNPNCGALKAQIVYYDKNLGKFVYENIKSKEIANTIKTIKENPELKLSDLDEKDGSYSKLHWIYGQTKIKKENGKEYLEDWAIDFNGEKKLVRKVNIETTRYNNNSINID